MNRREHLLTILAEEASEVAVAISKAQRFGLKTVREGQSLTNAERIEQEIADLLAVAMKLKLRTVPTTAEVNAKLKKVRHHMGRSRKLGLLT